MPRTELRPRLLAISRSRDLAASESVARERRSQALLVIAWARFKSEEQVVNGARLGRWIVRVGNYSAAPVFDIRAEAIENGTLDALADAPVLAPGKEVTFEATSTDELHGPTAVLYFRDLAGRSWKRYQTGMLVEVDEHQRPL